MCAKTDWEKLEPTQSRQEEFTTKLDRARNFLAKEGYGGLLISRVDNFAWLTCGGDNFVPVNAEGGVTNLLVTSDSQYLIANNIELPRMQDEEIGDLPFEVLTHYWYEPAPLDQVRQLAGGKLAADGAIAGAVDVSGEMWKLRAELVPPEIDRFKTLGEIAASAMTETILEAARGDTEWELAAMLGGMLLSDGVVPTVLLVAADERISKYRHPLPTFKEVEDYAMIVLCARWRGLTCSITRFVSFGDIPAELARKNQAVAQVDAAYILNTVPGAAASDILATALETYEATGYGEEWKLHHQGGACGYAGRSWKATPGCEYEVLPNQAYAWNPSITGTKSEDTIIAASGAGKPPEIITVTPELPTVTVETPWGTIDRPAFYQSEG